MNFESAFITLTWFAIVLLTLGVIGCLRNIQLLSKSIEDRLQSPARLKPGDTVQVPQQLKDHLADDEHTLMLFVQAECSSCLAAIREVLPAMPPDAKDVIVLWKGDRHPDYATLGLPFSHEAFRKLNIGVTPFAVVLRDSRVVLSSSLGSITSINRVLEVFGAVRVSSS